VIAECRSFITYPARRLLGDGAAKTPQYCPPCARAYHRLYMPTCPFYIELDVRYARAVSQPRPSESRAFGRQTGGGHAERGKKKNRKESMTFRLRLYNDIQLKNSAAAEWTTSSSARAIRAPEQIREAYYVYVRARTT